MFRTSTCAKVPCLQTLFQRHLTKSFLACASRIAGPNVHPCSCTTSACHHSTLDKKILNIPPPPPPSPAIFPRSFHTKKILNIPPPPSSEMFPGFIQSFSCHRYFTQRYKETASLLCKKRPYFSTTRCANFHHSTGHRRRENEVGPVSDLFTNPVDRLQPLCQIPIIPDSDQAFRPTREEMEAASLLFEPQNVKGQKFDFLGSWPNPHIMPKWEAQELAFIGRSNVGKSSLLAAMFAQIPDLNVRTSKNPGHTKLMNVFNVNGLFHLVDMPGYGFNMPDHFETSVEAYLKSRRNKMAFILLDGRVGMTKNDKTYFKRYSDLKLPLCMVLTKIDLARPATLIRSIASVLRFRDETKADSCFPQPFLVSSINGEGLAFLQAFIAYITGHLQIESLS